MKCVILAGGFGTRLSEETNLVPKPMVEIGNRPIIWHIMKYYSCFGINEFIICCGYKGYVIKEYFSNYFLHSSDVTIDLSENNIHFTNSNAEPWKISLVDTGLNTQTGGRLKFIKDYLDDNESFCFTYGDGLSDVNIQEQYEFHLSHKKLATVLAVSPISRFGAMEINNSNAVTSFNEKPASEENFINGGFFILQKKVLDYIPSLDSIWEKEPLSDLASQNQLSGFKHFGFWQPMDTLREKNHLQSLIDKDAAPWMIW